MAAPPVINAEARVAIGPDDRSGILVWHAVWLLTLTVAFGGLLVALPVIPWPIVWAFAFAVLPALAALALHESDGPRARSLLLVMWAVCGGLACGMAGGVSGPLAAWCLAPAAAAAMLGSRRLWTEAAVLAVITGAVVALAQIAHLWPAPPAEPIRFFLGLLSLTTLGVGLAGGLTLSRRRLEARYAMDKAASDGFERLLTRQPHLLAAFDADGRVLSAFGYSPGGLSEALLLEQGLVASAEPADRPDLTLALDAALAHGRSEAVFRPLDHVDRYIGVSLARAEPDRLVGVLQDISGQKAREAQLEAARDQAEALNTGKSRFLANMSHELRTPLNTIMGFSDMMRAKLFGPLPPKYAEYADLIHESGRHLLDLINDVLDMSKIEADRYQLHLEAIDARDPVASALRLMRVQADDAGVVLRGSLPALPLLVMADSRAIKQIVLNLLSNALKFTPRGGRVDLSLEPQGGALELVVADTGVGIAPDDVKRLGQPFQQAGDAAQRARGAGLGLSLVRAFAELHGGQMIIESVLGEGTSVIVRIPGPILEPQPESRPSAKVIAFNPKVG
ncbi:MAG TPA: HAMP domain-containing sensor histidine kinase [Caulobacteraceae bacterium]|nr:HAMP domain-containing sensor histidine kinase [Caulobacteraceae bacterium]